MSLIATRMRLELYLDGAVDAFREFWVERPVFDLIQAGEHLRLKVSHKEGIDADCHSFRSDFQPCFGVIVCATNKM